MAGSAEVNAEAAYRILELGECRHGISVRAHQDMSLATAEPNTSKAQRWYVDVHPDHPTRLYLHVLESVRLRLRLDVPEPEGTSWRHALWTVSAGSNQLELSEREVGSTHTTEVEFLDPTDAWVELKCSISGWPRVITQRRSFDRGEHALEVSFGAGRIEGSLGRPFSAEDRVSLTWSENGTSATAEAGVDPSGRFAFPCAPAGVCTLRRLSASGPGSKVHVVAGETAMIEGL